MPPTHPRPDRSRRTADGLVQVGATRLKPDPVRASVRRLVERRRTVLVCAAVVLVAAAGATTRLTVDYSVEQFFPAAGPARDVYDRLRASFPQEDAQVVLLLESSAGDAAHVGRAADRIAEAFRAAGLEDVHAAPPRAGAPELDGILWSSDGRVRSVVGHVPERTNHDAGRARVEADLSQRLASLELADVSWVITGAPVIRARVADLFARDQMILLGGGFLVFLVVLWITFGGAAPALAALATVLPAYLVTLGIMALAGRAVTLLTGFTVVVVLVVGLCDVVHVLEAVRRSRGRVRTTEDAVVDAFASLAVPCFYTSLTTAAGFAALALTGIGIVVEFALFTALAVLLTWAFAMTLLPALLASRWAPVPAGGGRVTQGLERLTRHAQMVASRGRPAPVILSFAAVGGLALVGVRGLEVDARLVDDLRPGSPVLQDLRWAEDRGFGVFQVNVFLEGVAPRDLQRPEMARWLGATERWLREQPLVMAALGPATATRVAPELARGLIDPGAGTAQIMATVPDVGSRRLLPLLERVEERLEEVPPPMGLAGVTGTVAMAQTFSSRLVRSFGPSLLLAVLLIAVVMTWMFRSVRLGALALVPNLFPLLVLGGFLAMLGIALKPSTILVFSIAFGIAVDDSVHLMARYTAARRWGADPDAAVGVALSEAGPAILLTSAMVTIGFSLLFLSSFQVLALIGGMSMLAAFTAVAADLYLFPALLSARGRSPQGRALDGRTAGATPAPRPPLPAPPPLRGGVRIPMGHRLEMRIFVRPGRRLADTSLQLLAANLRSVTAECLGGRALSYGVMSGSRDRMAQALIILLRERLEGRPLGFTAATFLPAELNGGTENVLHMGLSMVVPGLQRRGLARLLVSLPPALALLRSGLRPVWVTNVSQVPAAVGMFGEAVADLHPAPAENVRAPVIHRAIADQLMARHRSVFGVGDDAHFDPETFVIRNAYTGGSDGLRKDWTAAQRHRDARWNRLCRVRLDYRRGDDLLQVGRMTVGHTARVLGRFVIHALRMRARTGAHRLDPATSVGPEEGVA